MAQPVPISRRFAALATATALCLSVAACGEDDVDKARQDLKDAAAEAKGSLNDLSKDDLQRALDDAESAAKNGSADTKKKARELQRKIERELDSRR
jgi:polyhydroxyalkanoate synthesis regulator phasin